MQRRHLFFAGVSMVGVGGASVFAGYDMSGKKKIKTFGKSLAYLQDPELRKKETADALLTIEGAEIGGVDFRDLAWRNVTFRHCEFVGAYEIKLQSMDQCLFEGCRFSGIFAWGVQNKVRFVACTVEGESHLWGAEGSRAVSYEQCKFVGTNPERNHWGSVGTYGEATFLRCSGKWMGVFGHSSLIIRECVFESMDCKIDANESNGVVPVTLISDSKLRGNFDMVSSSFQSLTIRSTALDRLDLSGATVKSDFVMERVRGGSVNAWMDAGPNVTIRDSQFTPNPGFAFEFKLRSPNTRTVLIDKVRISGGEKPALISFGAVGEDPANVPAPQNQSFVLINSQIDRLDASYLNSSDVRFERNTIDSLDLSHSRIGKLELTGNTIARSVDFTGTQVKESQVQPLAKGQARLDGSNVKPN